MSGEVPDMLGANAEILRSILSQPLPDTLDMIIWRGVTNSAQASPFEPNDSRHDFWWKPVLRASETLLPKTILM
ncbi:hypothetical protein [Bifidobacterium pseudocatenulatum]|uniref:hypothetical protein n=1 Tax=Bifidobacterium pseudocatenulatum TaxID=28026 RepID=UPI0022DF5305|nr:hypothetical protein [Bifidobacterium pseudocatenulatum]